MTVDKSQKAAPARVLVADDDITTRLWARRYLTKNGFSVHEAEDGEQALSVFQSCQPQLIMLDVNMPNMDGFTACTQLRRMPGGEKIPVLMVTGLDDLESINRAYEAGATDFVTKPISWPILCHRLRYMLRASSASQALHVSEARHHAFLEALPDTLLRLNKDGILLDLRQGKTLQTALTDKLRLGKSLTEILPQDAAQLIAKNAQRALVTRTAQAFEYQLPSEAGVHTFEIHLVASDSDEVITIVRDITERRRAEERIHFLAFHDELTGLPNRQLFRDRLAQALKYAERDQRSVAVLFLDLDNFKRINNTVGHGVGDQLLREIADRLWKSIRACDSVSRNSFDDQERTLARLGGDEFTVLLAGIQDPEAIITVVQRIQSTLSHPFNLSGHEVVVTLSIGVAVYPHDGGDLETLLVNSHRALHHAKALGKNTFQFYAESMNNRASSRLTLENKLRKALAQDQLQLYYQPKAEARTGRIVGMEALLRWWDPDLGHIPPLDFIPLAEETGLIMDLGNWVFRKACHQNRAWQKAGFLPMGIAVNLSGLQFRQSDLAGNIADILNAAGLEPQYLELELTESILMQTGTRTVSTLHHLKEMGIRLSVDDFGTGYSSLSYLKHFPIDCLKIDRSFIKDMSSTLDDVAIPKAIIAMAHSLKLNVVAEGVETEEQLSLLRQLDCDQVQGYLIGRPVPAEEFTQLLTTSRTSDAGCEHPTLVCYSSAS